MKIGDCFVSTQEAGVRLPFDVPADDLKDARLPARALLA